MARHQIRKCAKCPNQLLPVDTALCCDCKEHSRLEARKRNASRKTAGICQRCGGQPTANGTMCVDCRRKHNAISRKIGAAKRVAGLCEQCPNPSSPGRSRCAACLRADNNRRLANLQEKGLCRCGKYPPRPGHRSCSVCSQWHKQNNLKLKISVLTHYGDGVPLCTCCGEAELHFLNIDHINGGGAEHRRQIGRTKLYRWLVNNDFPTGFQVLCANCNFGKSICGECPHVTARRQSGGR